MSQPHKVRAKRLGWDEKLSDEQSWDLDPFDEDDPRPVEVTGTLTTREVEADEELGIKARTDHFVDGQLVDSKTIEPVGQEAVEVKAKDDSGHEHKGKGPGGGQFTSGGSGGGSGKSGGGSGKSNGPVGGKPAPEHDKEDIAHLMWYKHHGYHSINKGLRSGTLSKNALKAVQSIDKLATPAPMALVLYRGVKWGKTGNTTKMLNALEVGGKFHDSAFASTSTDPKTAKLFAKNHELVVVYSVPEGHQVIDVEEVLGTKGTEKDEEEYLLPRGQSWKVSKIETNGLGKFIHVYPDTTRRG